MKPDNIYKISGKKIPVFKTPLLKKTFEQIMLKDIGDFIIQDRGKVKIYNTQGNLPKTYNLFDGLPSFKLSTIIKFGFVCVLGQWVYRLGTYRPNLSPLNPFKVDKDYLEKMKEKYSWINKKSYPGSKAPETNEKETDAAQSGASATLPNGWVINPN